MEMGFTIVLIYWKYKTQTEEKTWNLRKERERAREFWTGFEPDLKLFLSDRVSTKHNSKLDKISNNLNRLKIKLETKNEWVLERKS